MRGNALMRPGTIFIVALGIVIGMGVYNWSAQLLPQVDETSGSASVDCATLDVGFVDRSDNGTHSTVYIQSNRDQPYAVIFQGESSNFTRIVQEPAPGTIYKLTAPVSPVKDLRVKVDGCSRVFRP